MDVPLFFYLPIEKYLAYFWFLVIMNKAAISTCGGMLQVLQFERQLH